MSLLATALRRPPVAAIKRCCAAMGDSVAVVASNRTLLWSAAGSNPNVGNRLLSTGCAPLFSDRVAPAEDYFSWDTKNVLICISVNQ